MYRFGLLKRSCGALWTPWGAPWALWGPLGSSLDPLGGIRKFDQVLCKSAFQLLAKFGPENQNIVFLQKKWFQLLGKFGPENEHYVKMGGDFPCQKCQNHYNYRSKWITRNSHGKSGKSGKFPEMESSTAAPSLCSTCAGGHDDGS